MTRYYPAYSYHFSWEGAMTEALRRARQSGGRYQVKRSYNAKYPRSKWIVTPVRPKGRSRNAQGNVRSRRY